MRLGTYLFINDELKGVDYIPFFFIKPHKNSFNILKISIKFLYVCKRIPLFFSLASGFFIRDVVHVKFGQQSVSSSNLCNGKVLTVL